MGQSIVDSGHFRRSSASNTATSVSNLDTEPSKQAVRFSRRPTVWPVFMIGLGGAATVAWSGFLIWQTARALIGWVGFNS